MNGSRQVEFVLNWSDYCLDLGKKTHIMGVLNVTPDSFSDGGAFFNCDKAIEQGLAMVRQGADIIDIGGESTRPYSKSVSEEDELKRVIPVIEALRRETTLPISIDTCKGVVARQALTAGASIINDISAFRFDPEMVSVAAEAKVPVILMHMKGTPGNMQNKPEYDDLITEVLEFLNHAIDKAVTGGVRRELIIIDPGIGFGKTFDHNLKIMKELERFSDLGQPLLLGTSRKAFIGHILGKDPDERDVGTMATVSAGIMKGAHIVRVHNVEMAVETVKIIDSIMGA